MPKSLLYQGRFVNAGETQWIKKGKCSFSIIKSTKCAIEQKALDILKWEQWLMVDFNLNTQLCRHVSNANPSFRLWMCRPPWSRANDLIIFIY